MTSQSQASAGDLVVRIVRSAADDLDQTRAGMLEDVPDGLHQHRTRVRRLRSVLAGFRDVLDEPAVERLRVLYAEWGRQLGVARDLEVLADAGEAELASRGIADGAAFERLVDRPRAEYARAHARLGELIDLRRARERDRLLRGFVLEPRVDDPQAPADDLVSTVLRHEARRVLRAAKLLDGTDAPLHALRKAARRLRYVSEAIASAAPEVHPEQVATLADAGDAIHDRLGGHRDAVAFLAFVEREGVLAGRAGEPADVYGDIAHTVRAETGEKPPGVKKPLARIREARLALD